MLRMRIRSKKITRCHGLTILLLWILLLGSWPGISHGKSETSKASAEDRPAATVRVEVRDTGEKETPAVKVEIQGKEVERKEDDAKSHSSATKSSQTEERIAPVDTEKIDEAGKRLSKSIDELAEQTSHRLGAWVKKRAFNGITWFKLIIACCALVILFFVERSVRLLLKKRLERIDAEQRPPTWPEVLLAAIRKPLSLFIWVYSTYAILSPLLTHFEDPFQLGHNAAQAFAKKAADVGGILALVWFVYRVIRLVDLELGKRAKSPDSRLDDLEVALIGKTLRWVIVIFGAVLVIQYLTGIQAGPLIASLGIGGLAVALAAKESIGNLFGTVTIVFDRPFRVGDRVKIETYDGFVEAVGYRSTKLRLWNGNLVNLPNEKIVSSNLENLARRPHILWRTAITITYDTPPDMVDRSVEILKEIFNSDQDTCQTPGPWIFFDGFNDWSLNIKVMAWYKPQYGYPETVGYYEWRQRACRQILKRFNDEGIDFAFPTRTTHLANDAKRQLKILMLGDDEREQGAGDAL